MVSLDGTRITVTFTEENSFKNGYNVEHDFDSRTRPRYRATFDSTVHLPG
jgi:hypothetical protein